VNLIDTHSHLHFPEYADDLPAALDRSRDAGVRFWMNVGTHLACSERAVRLAQSTEGMYAAVGCHPHDAKDFREEQWEAYRNLARQPKVAALGEIGLDFYRNLSEPAVQEAVFRKFLALHRETGLAVILHIREAHADTFRIVEEELKPPVRGVLHCFSGDAEVLTRALSLGFWISFAGNVTYKKNSALRELAAKVPEDKILIETDAPFLSPEGLRGKRNEPAYLAETARCIAAESKISVEELAGRVTRNAAKLFGIPLAS
jgi:TatD DNase family protein